MVMDHVAVLMTVLMVVLVSMVVIGRGMAAHPANLPFFELLRRALYGPDWGNGNL